MIEIDGAPHRRFSSLLGDGAEILIGGTLIGFARRLGGVALRGGAAGDGLELVGVENAHGGAPWLVAGGRGGSAGRRKRGFWGVSGWDGLGVLGFGACAGWAGLPLHHPSGGPPPPASRGEELGPSLLW